MGARRRRLRAVLTVAAAGAAASSAACSPARDAPPVYESEVLMRSLFDALVTADTTLILDLFWPDATYDDFANQITHQGPQEIVGYVTGVHAWADDVYLNVGRLHASETTAVAEWVFSGVQARPIGELAPIASGREVVLNGITIIEIEGDRIIRAADYVDTAPMLLQLGGRIEMPGGGVMELDSLGG